jgi:hopanoid C-3 methylase
MMRVLLIKPRPDALQFGLAPFFQTEPLGLEYIAAALKERLHVAMIVDLRFHRRPLSAVLKSFRPDVVGISCLHILDAHSTLRLASEVKTFDKNIFVVVGGHAASAYPQALQGSHSIDALCLGEGERFMPALCDTLEQKLEFTGIPSLALRSESGEFRESNAERELLDLGRAQPPDRSTISAYRKNYCCLNYMSIWALETTRGCPHKCNFCSVWQFYKGSCRFHNPESVCNDFAAIGRNVFVIDDIFWAEAKRSKELARMLIQSGVRKNWMLVQSRADIVARNPELLEIWRPLAQKFDIFFGFESATVSGLDSLNKRMDISETIQAVNVARKLGFGVTGNFIIDPSYTEEDFKELWQFVERHKLYRSGFTILTPLPGTEFYDQTKNRLQDFNWNHYDLHHLLWPPKLPVEKFFELYCETWRRSVLNLAGRKKWWSWLAGVRPTEIPRLAHILFRTQKLMNPKLYCSETMDFNKLDLM